MADRPSEWTFQEYRETVELHAEAVLEAVDEYPEDYATLHDAVRSTVDGARPVIYHGWALMTVLLSGQDPDDPEYCEGWTARALPDGGVTWTAAVSAMAYVCLYSDVFREALKCPDCNGTGDRFDPRGTCARCDGTGKRDFDDLSATA